MSSQIKVTGNLTKDPELKFAESGIAYANFGLADTFKEKNGEENTTWYDVVVFGDNATNLVDSARKGARITVSGRFSTKEFDRKDGTKGLACKITGDEVSIDLRFASAQISKNERRSPAMSNSSSYDDF
jgi:single-strand DNA-binding protein